MKHPGGIALAATLDDHNGCNRAGTIQRDLEQNHGARCDCRRCESRYALWGFRDENGKIIGMEVDMAQQVADTMGVKLEFVAVESSEPYAVSGRWPH